MFGFSFGNGWLTKRQVREALANGQLDEASRLLGQANMRGHKKGFELQKQVSRGFIDRAEKHLRSDAVPQAWEDLHKAEIISPNDPIVEKFRATLMRLGLAEVKAALEAGRPGRAAEAIARLRDFGVHTADVQPYDEVARSWLTARESADLGEFAVAIQAVSRLKNLLPPPTTGLDEFRQQIEERHGIYQQAMQRLYDAVDQRRWREVVQQADVLIGVAPQSPDARKAKMDAWRFIEPDTTTMPGVRDGSSGEIDISQPAPSGTNARRLLLWVDAVGGYLICMSPRITFGQATGDAPVDIPLFADVSRMHATLSRDAEGYLIEASRPVQVNGQFETRTLLKPGDRVTLGNSCQFIFQQPVPVSTSARLEMVSGHRLPYSINIVLLMSESLVLGPTTQSHIPLPDRKDNLVIYRHKEGGLGLRCPGDFVVDGQKCKERGVLGVQATASGPDFSLGIEPAVRI